MSSAAPAAWSRSRSSRVPGVGQVREARAELVGVGADQRAAPGQVDVIAHDHQRPRPERRVEPAGGVGQDHDPRTELPEQQDRLDDEPGVVALVQVEAALEHDHASARPACRGGAVRRARARSPRASRAAPRTGSRRHPRGRPPARRARSRGRSRPRAPGRCGCAPRPPGRPDARAVRWAGSGASGRPGSNGTSGPPLRIAGRRSRPVASPARRKYRHRDADHVPSGSGLPGDRGETDGLAWQRSARSDRRRSKRPLM